MLEYIRPGAEKGVSNRDMTNEEAVETLSILCGLLLGPLPDGRDPEELERIRNALVLSISSLQRDKGFWTEYNIIGSEFLTHSGSNGYEIHFRTDDVEKYEAVQYACRTAIGHGKPLPEPPKEET